MQIKINKRYLIALALSIAIAAGNIIFTQTDLGDKFLSMLQTSVVQMFADSNQEFGPDFQIRQGEPIESINPQNITAANKLALDLIFENIFDISTSWDLDENTRTATFNLGETLFHDGAELTCEDVAASIACAGLSDIEVNTDNLQSCTVSFTSTPDTFISDLEKTYIIPQHACGKNEILVGTGAYRLTDRTDDTFTFEAFEDYHQLDFVPPEKITLTTKKELDRDIDLYLRVPEELGYSFKLNGYEMVELNGNFYAVKKDLDVDLSFVAF